MLRLARMRLRAALDSPRLVRARSQASSVLERTRLYLEEGTEAGAGADGRVGWLRPKGNLQRWQLALLLAIAVTPFIMIAIRISAYPGVLGPSLSGGWIPSLGQSLNEMLSLHRVPAGDRNGVLYLLFLPMGAVLIAFARLTLGLRVIGFRAILISVGFQESGIIPSLILIAVVVSIVVGVRPSLVRIRLPYYARVSVIMSIAVLVLLTALLVAPWMRSEVIWGVAFFPVIVLGLLAEGIAKTLDRNSGLTAVWRTGMTIGIALLLAGVGQVPVLREVAIRFPELIFTQIATVILISEFLDLRLFQDLDARMSGNAMSRLASGGSTFRVAVIRNNRRNGVIGRIGATSHGGTSRRVVRELVRSLRGSGHTAKAFEGDITLIPQLREYLAPHPRTGEPGGIALDLSHGIQGELPATHVASMLEMAGVAYVGPGLHGRLATSDRLLAQTLLENAGIRTPHGIAVSRVEDIPPSLSLPVIVKPRHAARYRLRIARERRQLEHAVRSIVQRHHGQAMVEPYLSGREIHAILIGNTPVECLPLVEVQSGRQERACPAPLEPEIAQRVRDAATEAFRACECRDYAGVNLRVSSGGTVQVLEVGEMDWLDAGGSFEVAARAAGWREGELLGRILAVARARYQLAEAPQTPARVVAFDPRRLSRKRALAD